MKVFWNSAWGKTIWIGWVENSKINDTLWIYHMRFNSINFSIYFVDEFKFQAKKLKNKNHFSRIVYDVLYIYMGRNQYAQFVDNDRPYLKLKLFFVFFLLSKWCVDAFKCFFFFLNWWNRQQLLKNHNDLKFIHMAVSYYLLFYKAVVVVILVQCDWTQQLNESTYHLDQSKWIKRKR